MARYVPNGQGKGWAKDRTAATDARIAKNADAHRGKCYQRHLTPDQDRRHRRPGGVRTLPLEWSDAMAYVVGLMATDGCLVSNRRHLNFKSQDEQLVRTFLRCLGRPMSYSTVVARSGHPHFVVQFGDVQFYRWLESIGLMPKKSLLLGALAVPDRFLFHTVRGLFDGDGHISNFVHRPTVNTYPNYRYERLWVFFNSASRPHLAWIQERVAQAAGLRGYIEMLTPREGRQDFFRLKYGNQESIALLRAIYPTSDVPRLERKWLIWDAYADRHQLRSSVPTAGLEPA